jgi:hypothetical protein
VLSIGAAGTDYVAPGATTSSGLTMATARILGRTTASSGAIEEITVGSGLSLSGGSLTATGGASVDPHTFHFRITTESGVPVSTTDRTAQSTIYVTPYEGNSLALYNGSAWESDTSAEFSLALSGLTSGKNYDVFVYSNSGTPTIELSAAWTNDTTRADALTTQDGILVKSGATTRRYVGTIRTTGTTTTEDSMGGATTEVGGKAFVWNMYNRVRRPLKVMDTENSWTYATNAFRAMHGSSGNRVEFVQGVADCTVNANAVANVFLQNNDDSASCSIGVDSTTVSSALHMQGYKSTASPTIVSGSNATYIGCPGLGYHFLAPLERANLNTVTFFGDNNGTCQSGLTAWIDR